MDVKAITLEYLKANGYDGLRCLDECGCQLEDLFPCGMAGVECCEPGYLQMNVPDGFDFCIGPDKDRMPTPEPTVAQGALDAETRASIRLDSPQSAAIVAP